ncbi:MAG: hypothetical protein KBB78_02875 [Candidatus Pacebacteria bacterium]|nr:hypothetical protein [Candidatus Paceibacterota bacterium]
MDEEDEPITIDHLIGVTCILNSSLQVELCKNLQKDNRIELFTDERHPRLVVTEITDLTANGAFIVTICNRQGKVLTEKGVLIAESLFASKKHKGATV